MKLIDLRSDTVTLPTPEMREAMAAAEVGDDVYGDDPTVNHLEKIAASISGKEAALFVPSGTFGNQLSLMTHCKRGDEVILGDDCHIVQHETGAASVIADVQLRTLSSDKGILNPDEIGSKIRTKDIHFPDTGLICLENAHSNGRVIPLDIMKEIYYVAQKHEVPVHLDGARLFNAGAALAADAREITQYCDSVMFCLSKGLCAPVGSILAGNRQFIDRARKGRKLMGGGLRQSGILAAAGIIALEKMALRVHEDHSNAIFLGEELAKIPGIRVFTEDIQINMVFFSLADTGFDPILLRTELLKKGIKINPPEGGIMRFVTHYGITKEDLTFVVNSLKETLTN